MLVIIATVLWILVENQRLQQQGFWLCFNLLLQAALTSLLLRLMLSFLRRRLARFLCTVLTEFVLAENIRYSSYTAMICHSAAMAHTTATLLL